MKSILFVPDGNGRWVPAGGASRSALLALGFVPDARADNELSAVIDAGTAAGHVVSFLPRRPAWRA